ncbi:MAG: GNAT family N-acetyltransferase [Byssovorax sp.]
MLFCDTALAARIERAERRLLLDCVTASRQRDAAAGAVAIPLAGGVAAFTGPDAPTNKVAGLGFEGPVPEPALVEVEHAFAERRCAVRVELSTLADPSIGTLLTSRGYRLLGFENVLGKPLGVGDAGPVLAADVTESPADELDAWLDVRVTGFATPDLQGVPSTESFPREVIERAMEDLVRAEGFTRYTARRGGALAGAASMRLFEGVALLTGAATLPTERRKGVQSALLHARLRAAREAGCDVAVITTQPGSKSQQNVQRLGFSLLYARAVLVREG